MYYILRLNIRYIMHDEEVHIVLIVIVKQPDELSHVYCSSIHMYTYTAEFLHFIQLIKNTFFIR